MPARAAGSVKTATRNSKHQPPSQKSGKNNQQPKHLADTEVIWNQEDPIFVATPGTNNNRTCCSDIADFTWNLQVFAESMKWSIKLHTRLH